MQHHLEECSRSTIPSTTHAAPSLPNPSPFPSGPILASRSSNPTPYLHPESHPAIPSQSYPNLAPVPFQSRSSVTLPYTLHLHLSGALLARPFTPDGRLRPTLRRRAPNTQRPHRDHPGRRTWCGIPQYGIPRRGIPSCGIPRCGIRRQRVTPAVCSRRPTPVTPKADLARNEI